MRFIPIRNNLGDVEHYEIFERDDDPAAQRCFHCGSLLKHATPVNPSSDPGDCGRPRNMITVCVTCGAPSILRLGEETLRPMTVADWANLPPERRKYLQGLTEFVVLHATLRNPEAVQHLGAQMAEANVSLIGLTTPTLGLEGLRFYEVGADGESLIPASRTAQLAGMVKILAKLGDSDAREVLQAVVRCDSAACDAALNRLRERYRPVPQSTQAPQSAARARLPRMTSQSGRKRRRQ